MYHNQPSLYPTLLTLYSKHKTALYNTQYCEKALILCKLRVLVKQSHDKMLIYSILTSFYTEVKDSK